MPVPTKVNISHYRGDSLALQIKLWTDTAKTVPADLSEAIVTAQVRETPDDATIIASFDVEVTGNVINANLSPKSSRDLLAKNFWDLQVDWFGDDSSVQTVVGGGLIAAPDVTRDGA
jgi:hypothetical protein